MPIILNNSFLLIVYKAENCERDLYFRARRAGDIPMIFGVEATKIPHSDYLYRADIPRADVAVATNKQITGINYDNFKASVDNPELHGTYLGVWSNLRCIDDRYASR